MYLHHHVNSIFNTAKRTIKYSSIHCAFQPKSFTESNKRMDLAYSSYESTLSYTKKAPEPTPLIVLHGFLESKNNWDSICKNLHKNSKAKVVAVDARNHGDSPHCKKHTYDCLATDLKNFLENMNFKKVSLLGHSMGGRTAMLFALKYPELVEKLIITDVSPISSSSSVKMLPGLMNSLKQIQIPPNKSLYEAKKIIGPRLYSLIKNRLMFAYLLTNLVQKNDGSYGWRFNTKTLLENFEQMTSFPNIFNVSFEGRTMFLGGGNSDHIQKSDFPKILKLFPNAELKYIEGAGHWLHSEKPAEFLSITLEFLNRRSDIKQLESKTIN
ncbi:protein ABHD11-like isoform X2 [Diabrotica virgifera virgifera]|uniref:sn-1-specific diacylglycerol lipase ABHD11 n=1 Tax=Diabrotica virgifera virgifera TaxID=50390 RepID=A0A6P7GJ90_DIAVI|nr:protein ABHD11-like isoform X2 [Diabrotica virgifera virgifera]